MSNLPQEGMTRRRLLQCLGATAAGAMPTLSGCAPLDQANKERILEILRIAKIEFVPFVELMKRAQPLFSGRGEPIDNNDELIADLQQTLADLEIIIQHDNVYVFDFGDEENAAARLVTFGTKTVEDDHILVGDIDALAPDDLMHEAAHVQHPNHSDEMVQCVEATGMDSCDAYERFDVALKENDYPYLISSVMGWIIDHTLVRQMDEIRRTTDRYIKKANESELLASAAYAAYIKEINETFPVATSGEWAAASMNSYYDRYDFGYIVEQMGLTKEDMIAALEISELSKEIAGMITLEIERFQEMCPESNKEPRSAINMR
ncbi:MAG: hypothetical protein ABIG66_04725 [Candidatus Kerfeldbacteria bacterium]